MRQLSRVLVVDDEPSDVEFIGDILAAEGYKVIPATDAAQAVREHAAYPEKINLLIADVAMSPMNGCELAALLQVAQPDLEVLFISGYVGEQVLRRKEGVARSLFLRKPFTRDELVQKVREALGDRSAVRTEGGRAHG